MNDHAFQKLFDEIKASDAQHAPEFNSFLPSLSNSRKSWPLRIWIPLALAASVLLAALISFTVLAGKKPGGLDEISQWEAISHWEAPSDSMLAATIVRDIGDPVASSTDLLFESKTPDPASTSNQTL